MEKSLQIRNSTAEFLTFVLDGKEDGVQVLYKDETIWATQKAMSILFDCSTDNIGLHLKNIFNSNELDVNSTTEKISVVQTEGDRDVNRTMTFYNLDAVISVGYRVNSLRATQFRQWTTNIIRQFAIRGYIFCDMPYRLLIIFSAFSADIGSKRLNVFPSLSITSSNIAAGLTHMP